MFEIKKCHQCHASIEIGESFARFKNPLFNPNLAPSTENIQYLFFHQNGRGTCYWIYLRDHLVALKVNSTHPS